MLFAARIYFEFYEFPVICDILTAYNLAHNHPSKDNLKQHRLECEPTYFLKKQILNLYRLNIFIFLSNFKKSIQCEHIWEEMW